MCVWWEKGVCVCMVGGGCVCVWWEKGACVCGGRRVCVCVVGEGCVCGGRRVRVCMVGGGCVCGGSACERQVRALKGNILHVYTIYVLLIDCQLIVQS